MKSIIVTLMIITLCAVSAFALTALQEVEEFYLRKQYVIAINQATQFLDASSAPATGDAARIQYVRGLAYLKLGKFTEARDDFNQLMARFDDSDIMQKAHLGLVHTFYAEGNFTASSQAAKSFLSRYPKSNYLSRCYLAAGKAMIKEHAFAAARFHLNYCVQNFPESVEASAAAKLLAETAFIYTLQVGAFGSQAKAAAIIADLTSRGYQPYSEKITGSNGILYRIRITGYTRRAPLERDSTALKALGYDVREI